jgi:hypothetical protein
MRTFLNWISHPELLRLTLYTGPFTARIQSVQTTANKVSTQVIRLETFTESRESATALPLGGLGSVLAVHGAILDLHCSTG